MKIKISAQSSAVLPTGPYQNQRPGFSAEAEFELDQEVYGNGKMAEFVADRQAVLYEVCNASLKKVEEQAVIERINRERADFRWYGSFPSVTSIIGWDSDFFCSPEELREYAAHGNLLDAQVKFFIETGEWKPVKEIPDTWADLVIVKRGKLNLPIDAWDFPAFLQKYPIEKMEVGKPVVSKKHQFGGTPDIRVCYYEGKKYMADVKRTPDAVKHFKQCAAYIIAEEENGEKPYEGMMLIPANGAKTKQGFSKPVTTLEIAQYKKMFLDDREKFRKRFGV